MNPSAVGTTKLNSINSYTSDISGKEIPYLFPLVIKKCMNKKPFKEFMTWKLIS